MACNVLTGHQAVRAEVVDGEKRDRAAVATHQGGDW
jgi:hypothetical protein